MSSPDFSPEFSPEFSPANQSAGTGDLAETFNPWSVVHLVFEHLCSHDLHPTLGAGGDPAAAATDLLRALAIQPNPEGNREVMRAVRADLDLLRQVMLDPPAVSE